MNEREQAAEEFKAAWLAYREAQTKADNAFARYFSKRERGEKTNGAAYQRLENEANYLSADLESAALRLWAVDIDPASIVPEYEEA